jgi:hypothetical protein
VLQSWLALPMGCSCCTFLHADVFLWLRVRNSIYTSPSLLLHLAKRPQSCCSTIFVLQAVRTRFQLHKSITPDYYGFRDEEDGVLLAVEAEAEQTILAQVT